MLKNLRIIRKARNMTQKQLSDRAKVNRINISQYEIGVKNPNLTTVQKLASALGCTIEQLLGTEEKTG